VDLEAARLLREGFLRQSALSPADASSPPAKTLAMLRAFLHLHRCAGQAVGRGVALRSTLSTGIEARLLRLAELPADEAVQAATAAMQALDGHLLTLEAPA
jgi:V/A-type H+-transporting ATPase subunit A